MSSKRRAFLEGIAVTLDIAGTSSLRRKPAPDTVTALRRDWERVGRDLGKAAERYGSAIPSK